VLSKVFKLKGILITFVDIGLIIIRTTTTIIIIRNAVSYTNVTNFCLRFAMRLMTDSEKV